MDIKTAEIKEYKVQELIMIAQITALGEMIDGLGNASAEDVGIACRRSTASIRMYSDWAETTALLNVMRDLRVRIKAQLDMFYKTCISDRGTTIGMALDFAKFNTEDICGNKKKGNKTTPSKCSK